MKPVALFAVWPYVALALFAAGIAARYLLSRRRRAALETGNSESWEAFRGGALWRVGMALLFFGHLLGVLLPRGILAWNMVPARLYLLEAVAFASGVAALLGWTGLLWRHMGRGAGSLAAELADTAFLSLLGLALASGLVTAVLYRWGSSWGVMTLAPYAWSVLRGRPLTDLASQLPYLAQLHVAAALAALAIAPWTRLGAFLVVALHRMFQAMGRPVATVSTAVEAWFRKRNPGTWIWPDED